MTLERDRDLLTQVVTSIVGSAADVEWMAVTRHWTAHARLTGRSGRVGHLLTSPEWQEARFEDPRCSAFILTTTDEDDVRAALTELARAVVEYLTTGGSVERRRGLFGSRLVLALRTRDGEWRIGPRSTQRHD